MAIFTQEINNQFILSQLRGDNIQTRDSNFFKSDNSTGGDSPSALLSNFKTEGKFTFFFFFSFLFSNFFFFHMIMHTAYHLNQLQQLRPILVIITDVNAEYCIFSLYLFVAMKRQRQKKCTSQLAEFSKCGTTVSLDCFMFLFQSLLSS